MWGVMKMYALHPRSSAVGSAPRSGRGGRAFESPLLDNRNEKVKVGENMNEFLELEEQVLRMIKTVYDPEIPVNVYELGLIYRIDLPGEGVCNIEMTLTAPNCPAADFLVEDIKQKVSSVDGISEVNVNIVFEPEWNKDMMSEEAKLELGFL